MKITKSYYFVFFALAACSEQPASPPGKLDPNGVRVGIMVNDWPRTVKKGTEFQTAVTISNLGSQPLPQSSKDVNAPFQINATYHWLAADSKPIVWDGVRTPLGAELKKLESRDLHMTMRAPTAPGSYILQIDLVQESKFWFGGVGSQTANMIVNVQ